jgi:hypothetical protein
MTSPNRAFVVPLKRIIETRRRFEAHARAAEVAGRTTAPWQFCIDQLQQIANDVRSAGLQVDGPTPADRAAARAIAEAAIAAEYEAERFRDAATNQINSTRQSSLGAASLAEARARHLWHGLMALMEHAGLGPEDLDVVIPTPNTQGHPVPE